MPPNDILNNRRKFYDLKAEDTETIDKWFERIFNHIDNCNFAKEAEYILTDRYVCELDTKERDNIHEGDLNWSIKCLFVSTTKKTRNSFNLVKFRVS